MFNDGRGHSPISGHFAAGYALLSLRICQLVSGALNMSGKNNREQVMLAIVAETLWGEGGARSTPPL